MELKGNTIEHEGRLVCKFDPETFEREYEEGVTKAQKMAIGRILKPYREGKKQLESANQGAETAEESVSEIESNTEEASNAAFSEENLGVPWEVFKDCPAPGAAGDKTEAVVKWVYKFQPKYYALYYRHRQTVIDTEVAAQRKEWTAKGEEYYIRGFKVSDCPIGASAAEREFFEDGYKKYMTSELEAQ